MTFGEVAEAFRRSGVKARRPEWKPGHYIYCSRGSSILPNCSIAEVVINSLGTELRRYAPMLRYLLATDWEIEVTP